MKRFGIIPKMLMIQFDQTVIFCIKLWHTKLYLQLFVFFIQFVDTKNWLKFVFLSIKPWSLTFEFII